MAKLVTNFVLNTETDKDISRWLARQDNRSAAIRDAIREYIGGGAGITIGDVYQAVKAVERKIERGVVTGGAPANGEDDYHEHPDVTAALGALGRL